jgi:hypothetical protein
MSLICHLSRCIPCFHSLISYEPAQEIKGRCCLLFGNGDLGQEQLKLVIAPAMTIVRGSTVRILARTSQDVLQIGERSLFHN